MRAAGDVKAYPTKAGRVDDGGAGGEQCHCPCCHRARREVGSRHSFNGLRGVLAPAPAGQQQAPRPAVGRQRKLLLGGGQETERHKVLQGSKEPSSLQELQRRILEGLSTQAAYS